MPLFLLPSCAVVRGGMRISLGRFPYCSAPSSSSSLGTTSSGTSKQTLCLFVSILCVLMKNKEEEKGSYKLVFAYGEDCGCADLCQLQCFSNCFATGQSSVTDHFLDIKKTFI